MTGRIGESGPFVPMGPDSLRFLGLVVLTSLALSFLGDRRDWRSRFLLGSNLLALAWTVRGLAAFVTLGVVAAATYGVARWHDSGRSRQNSIVPVAATVTLWSLLFLIKDPELFRFNPFRFINADIVGISYFTFRAIGYVLEAPLHKNRSFVSYVNYLIFFPTLLAGPIERFRSFEKDLTSHRPLDRQVVLASLHRIANGCLKKYVLADNLSAFGLVGMDLDADVARPLLWVAVVIQLPLLYLDFSGYCDVVIGVSRLLGFEIRENFDHPWRAANIQQFWDRWHMSLTHLLRDCVFTPICRFAFHRTRPAFHFSAILVALSVTMMLVAIWHGTTSAWIVYGAIHSTLLILLQMKKRWLDPRIKRWPSWTKPTRLLLSAVSPLATWLFVSLTTVLWVVGIDTTTEVFRRLAGGEP
jgi:alginate O-acetyltransferase complex protein AlgI